MSYKWGVSVEDRRHGLPGIDELRSAPASVRFLSIEPLLEDLGKINLGGIHWVIVGGESGHGARAMDPSWVTSIQKQCARARVWSAPRELESFCHKLSTGRSAGFMFETAASNSVGGR